jgi:hypothetical protein
MRRADIADRFNPDGLAKLTDNFPNLATLLYEFGDTVVEVDLAAGKVTFEYITDQENTALYDFPPWIDAFPTWTLSCSLSITIDHYGLSDWIVPSPRSMLYPRPGVDAVSLEVILDAIHDFVLQHTDDIKPLQFKQLIVTSVPGSIEAVNSLLAVCPLPSQELVIKLEDEYESVSDEAPEFLFDPLLIHFCRQVPELHLHVDVNWWFRSEARGSLENGKPSMHVPQPPGAHVPIALRSVRFQLSPLVDLYGEFENSIEISPAATDIHARAIAAVLIGLGGLSIEYVIGVDYTERDPNGAVLQAYEDTIVREIETEGMRLGATGCDKMAKEDIGVCLTFTVAEED